MYCFLSWVQEQLLHITSGYLIIILTRVPKKYINYFSSQPNRDMQKKNNRNKSVLDNCFEARRGTALILCRICYSCTFYSWIAAKLSWVTLAHFKRQGTTHSAPSSSQGLSATRTRTCCFRYNCWRLPPLIAFLVLILRKFGNDLKVLIPTQVELKPTTTLARSLLVLVPICGKLGMFEWGGVGATLSLGTGTHESTSIVRVPIPISNSSQFKSCLSLFVMGLDLVECSR